ncbi:ribbon-helix-helix domain-containing protein [Paenibacillus medicaginis]|uniref:Ribbon-helix-helix domain-containing protein n=1 Tax=Paenibacillus medicaginis TaxID=1470560 RepID=A0ABV5C904_9BACL
MKSSSPGISEGQPKFIERLYHGFGESAGFGDDGDLYAQSEHISGNFILTILVQPAEKNREQQNNVRIMSVDFTPRQMYFIVRAEKRGEAMSSKKLGRPPSDNPKSEKIEIRVDQEMMSKLDASAKKLNTTRSDIVRKGIQMVYNDLQK